MEEGERAKARKRNRQQQEDTPGVARHRTNKSASSSEPHGLTDQKRNPQTPFNMWAVARAKAQRPLGELLGVTIYAVISISANLAGVTSSEKPVL